MGKIIRYILYTLFIITLLLFVIILPTINNFALMLFIGIMIILEGLMIYNFEEDYWNDVKKLIDKIFGKEN